MTRRRSDFAPRPAPRAARRSPCLGLLLGAVLLLACRPAGPAAELPDGALLAVHREGGIVPTRDAWTFFADGRIVGAAGRSTRTQPALVERFVSVCEQVGEGAPGADPGACRDCRTYRFTYRVGNDVRSLTLVEGSPGVPAELWTALQPLRAAAESVARP